MQVQVRSAKKGERAIEKTINSSRAEQFNGWIRRSNFFLNHLRPASHRFWVFRLMKQFNNAAPKVARFGRTRTNAAARSMKKQTHKVLKPTKLKKKAMKKKSMKA